MGNVIYYFSGRGNSLSVAQGLARLVSDTEIRPMSSMQGEAVLPEGRAGFILPVIDFGIPAYVHDFLKRLKADGKQHYLFAVITCGGMPGASMMSVKKLLQKRGLPLAAGWILEFGRRMMTDGEWRIKLEEIADAIDRKEIVPLPPVSSKDHLLTGLLNPLARLLIPKEDKKFRVDLSCTGCGICTRVCPVNNIQIENGKPVWLHKCQQCAACFSWCPQKAISGTCLAAQTHYQNPRVRLDQLFDQGGMKR
jgi:ferredoxin